MGQLTRGNDDEPENFGGLPPKFSGSCVPFSAGYPHVSRLKESPRVSPGCVELSNRDHDPTKALQ